MENATILTVLGSNPKKKELASQLESARALNAHLSFLAIERIPPFPNYGTDVSYHGVPIIPESWQEDISAKEELLEKAEKTLEKILSDEDVSGDIKTACAEPGILGEVAARRAKLADFATIENNLRKDRTVFNQVLHGLLFASPAGVVLNSIPKMNLSLAKQIFVAWNTSLPAARAIHQALPILKSASQVTIACFDPVMSELRDGENPGSDVGKWLSHHGCNVTVQQYPSGGKEVGDCILERAGEQGADLVVAGAYGHSRMRETIFGGTTRILIEQTKVPVLLAH